MARLIVLSLFILSLLLFPVGCKTSDVASYKADEITLLAKNISPDCPAPVPTEGSCGCRPQFQPSLDEKVDAEFNTQYLGNKIWSVTKTCPIFSQYNEFWYFYEDIAQLAPKWLPPKAAEQPGQGLPKTPAVSGQGKGEAFNQLYVNMKERLEQAYTLSQQLQNFNWRSIEYLSWPSKGEERNERITHIKDILPSKEALQSLLMQNEKCNAFAVKLWLGNPYEKPTDQTGKHLTPATWYSWYTMNRKLEVEIGKAQDLANNIQLDASSKFADTDRELNITGAMSKAYVREVQMKCADYKALLDGIIENLEQSRLLALELRHLQVNPSVLDVP